MVHINQVEFENFKSFGGNVTIPLEEGFTVVTGPNGSGKSNILDGILFCLGLASSRGMRAERLPDLINNSKVKEGKSSETSVSVRFNIEDWTPRENIKELGLEDEQLSFEKNQKEWVVSRKLRLMPGGSYASTYTSDGKQCNLQQIQKLLRDIRVDPEGSNVVMQGDVTRIVSMSNKERRTLIDELAGVALFDSRIDQTHSKLNDVYERQERCVILQNELEANKLRLEKECDKARKYKQLKAESIHLKELEKILRYDQQVKAIELLSKKAKQYDEDKEKLHSNNQILNKEIIVLQEALEIIVKELKDKGEDELIKVNSDIGSINANLRELERLSASNKNQGLRLQERRDQITISKKNIEIEQRKLEDFDQSSLITLQKEINDLSNTHKLSRKKLSEAAGESGKFSKNTIEINNEIEVLQVKLKPLNESIQRIDKVILENNIQIDEIDSQLKFLQQEKFNITNGNSDKQKSIETNQLNLNNIKSEIMNSQDQINLLEKTKLRLSNERLSLEKSLSRQESRKEALNESRGSYALRILLECGLEGIHGYVAQLGEVEDEYRYALEIAGGNRLGQIVVDNELIASKAIEILKKKKAGRLTFLPLNRMKKSQHNLAITRNINNKQQGFINKAINLVKFDEIYNDVFNYVFGGTEVFTDLSLAKAIKNKNRVVTLSGELLEASGAITGGSRVNKDLAFRFGSSKELDEINPLKQRLAIVNEALLKSEDELTQKFYKIQNLGDEQRKLNEILASQNKEVDLNQNSLDSLERKINDNKERLRKLNDLNSLQRNSLEENINLSNPLTKKYQELQLSLKKNHEDNQNSSLLSINKDFEGVDLKLQKLIEEKDLLINQRNQIVLNQEKIKNEQNLISVEEKNLEQSIKELAQSHHEWTVKRDELKNDLSSLEKNKQILEKDLGILRRKRDELSSKISNKRQEQNEISLKLEYLNRDIMSLSEQNRNERIKLDEYKKDLPINRPDFGEYTGKSLDYLQAEISSINAKLESLEPVNMLALEELDDISSRLNDLVDRLTVLSNERSELLLRIETVSTMRQEAFMEAFEQVDRHFREIFADLSDGDGFLQLENKNLPLEGGLTLVAHPKGKNVRRLSSMSGGEKSLTALSFLFALQRYKPSPFYALDEVDSFLDGVNVERLSKLIEAQSLNAQFVVVSHRRPMISASMRTIGVAQARGAHTQVIGLPNAA